MNIGWVLGATDVAKDEKAYTIVRGERDRAKAKAEKIRNKFKDKFKLFTNSPYSEIDPSNRIIIRCLVHPDTKPNKLLNLIDESLPFLVKCEDMFYFIEINREMLSLVEEKLQKIEISLITA